jgi:pimeloyl-ACP methyl ester carboxylesterase
MLMPIVATLLAAAPDPLAAAPSRHASLDGGRVHYKSLGRGAAAVVFVHGWSCSLGVWRLQAPAFAARLHALFVDLPGHGGSDVPEGPCTQDLFARAIDAVLRDAGARDAVIVGHSNGVVTARQYYRLYPARTRGLVLVDGNLRPFTEPSRYPSIAASYDVPAYRDRIGRVVDGMTDVPPLRSELRRLMTRTPRRVVVSSLAELKDPAVWRPDPIAVPVLAVHARAGQWTPDYEAFVRRMVPGVDYRVWDRVGHFLMMERAEEFDAAVLGFLEAHGLVARTH